MKKTQSIRTGAYEIGKNGSRPVSGKERHTAEQTSKMDAKTKAAIIMGFIKSTILQKHKGMTKEQAMRVQEFEFEFDEVSKTIEGLE